mmetsp:Transcript_12922/g.14826  ORF Transcript_12922/g.14826 Transcript_12922/m.14826 type:complete len:429 (-) Transcript_12922:439-1725(-)
MVVDVSDIDVSECSQLKPFAKGLRILTKLTRQREKTAINELYNHMVSSNLDDKERKLKIQLFLSKLTSVISKKLDMVKFVSLNELKMHRSYGSSVNGSGKGYDIVVNNANNSLRMLKGKPERFGTDSYMKKTQSTNFGGRNTHSASSRGNDSGSQRRHQFSGSRSGIPSYQIAGSLIGSIMCREQMNLSEGKKRSKNSQSKTGDSLLLSESLNRFEGISEESSDSDLEKRELDEYLSRRLAKLEEAKSKREATASKEKKASQQMKSVSKEKVVVLEDSEYEYILESEEEEDEWSSESGNVDVQVDKIFTQSFMEENMRSSDVQARRSLKPEDNPFQMVSSKQKMNGGSVYHTVARRSEVKENGNVLQIEERKEDSYIHPAFENSVAFSNISGIFGQQTFNNHNLLSLKDDSFAHDYDDLEFENDLNEL